MKPQERRYHAIEVTNKWVSDADYAPKALSYKENLTTPILRNCGDWEIGVDRFDIDSGLVPIWYFPVLPNKSPYFNTDWTKSNLIVTLEYTGVSASSNVYLIRQDYTTDPPPTPTAGSDWIQSPHYFIYDVDHIVAMINDAFDKAFAALGALVVLPVTAVAPRLRYNDNQTLSIVVTQSDYHDGLALPIYIWFNKVLSSFFGNYYTKNYTIDTVTHKDELLVVHDIPEIQETYSGVVYLCVEQPYPNLFALCPFRYLEVRSPLLTVTKETHNSYDLANPHETVNKNVQAIMIDFELILENIDSIRGSSWVYVSRGKPNWVSMKPATELRRIDLEFWLRDSTGRYTPLMLDTGCSATIKLMFRMKDHILRQHDHAV